MKKKTTTYIRFDILRVSSDPGERINFFKKETETCQEFHTAPKKAKKKKKKSVKSVQLKGFTIM